MTNTQLFEEWAAQNRDSARAGNVSFEGPRLYSYRMPIAEIYPGVTFLVWSGPSNTTAKHIYKAHCVAPGGVIIRPDEITRPHIMLSQVRERLAQDYKGLHRKQRSHDFCVAAYTHTRDQWLEAQAALSRHPDVEALAPPPEVPETDEYFFSDLRAALREETTPAPPGKIKRAFKQYALIYREGAVREPITGRRLSPVTDEAAAWNHAARYLSRRTAADMGARLAEILLRNQEG